MGFKRVASDSGHLPVLFMRGPRSMSGCQADAKRMPSDTQKSSGCLFARETIVTVLHQLQRVSEPGPKFCTSSISPRVASRRLLIVAGAHVTARLSRRKLSTARLSRRFSSLRQSSST